MAVDLRKNIGIQAVGFSQLAGAAHPLLFGGRFARSCGRVMPKQAAASGTAPVLGEVASGVFASDSVGVAYPAGTLWARVFCGRDGTGTKGDGADDGTWIAVPDSLPAGYTANNRRNIRINQTITQSFGANNAFANVFPTKDYALWGTGYVADSWPALVYSGVSAETTDGHSAGTGPIRNANGVWYPHANTARDDGFSTGLYAWGPFNLNDTVLGPWFIANQYVGGADPIANHYNGTWFFPFSPGFRNVRLRFVITAAAAAAMPPTSYVEVAVDGGGLHTFTAAACAGGLDTTWDHGPSTLQAHGTLYQMELRNAGFNAPLGLGHQLFATCSPRVDIPLPWTCTSGNLVAPGGILTGTITGYP